MQNNTVILDLKEYNRLTEFEKEIKSGKKIVITNYSHLKSIEYVTDSEIASRLNKEIEDMEIINDRNIKQLSLKIKEIEDLKNLSIWQFIKLKIKYNESKTMD